MLLVFLVTAASAFHVANNPVIRSTALRASRRSDTFERAVKCSENYGLCDVDELLELADQLDSYKGSFFEYEPFAQEKEIKDREDVADILRLEAELALRQDYLHNANLFKEDVEKAKKMESRDELLDTNLMDEYAGY
jgi:hypothetical protein